LLALLSQVRNLPQRQIELPHSEIPGSKVGIHLPEAYRKNPTSFIASSNQGIRHTLLINFLLGNLYTNFIRFYPTAWIKTNFTCI
jgi:hypothetical protein